MLPSTAMAAEKAARKPTLREHLGLSEHPRSSVLAPLQWYLGICFSAAAAASHVAKDPQSLAVLAPVVMGCFGGVVLLVSFCFLLVSDPASLRSERFWLRKMELEKMGDSETGLIVKFGEASPPEDEKVGHD